MTRTPNIEIINKIIEDAKFENIGDVFFEENFPKWVETHTINNPNIEDWDITLTDDGMPVMKIPCHYHGKDVSRYLTPFRAYKFQMSGSSANNPFGDGDFGSSEVIPHMYKYPEMGTLGIKALDNMCQVAMLRSGAKEHYLNYTNYCIFMALTIAYLRVNRDKLSSIYGE
jgi:hypothetical protein